MATTAAIAEAEGLEAIARRSGKVVTGNDRSCKYPKTSGQSAMVRIVR